MDPNAQPISPYRFETGFLQDKQAYDRRATNTYDPNKGGFLDGGNPYQEPEYPPGRQYDEATFFDREYIQKYNDILADLRRSKEVGIPTEYVPEGIG